MDGGALDLSEVANMTTMAANMTAIATNITTPLANVTSVPANKTSFIKLFIFTKAYFLGLVGNALALMFLVGFCEARPPRNSKHRLMLLFLAVNDLFAVIGMWTLTVVKQFVPEFRQKQAYCIASVLWRSFGLGSGSIVIVMAVERWLALTRPFFYQKYVTVGAIRRSILCLWSLVLLLSSMPLFGFGLYWKNNKCYRYKSTTNAVEQGYAYLYMAYVLVLLICLVFCNVGVIKALVRTKSTTRSSRGVLVRRISRNRDLATSSNTAEEIAFARVMGLLCIVFYICWVPQAASIPMWHFMPGSDITQGVTNVADTLLLMHFSVDPYFYVLQRWRIFKSFFCWKRSESIRANSTKTTHELVSL